MAEGAVNWVVWSCRACGGHCRVGQRPPYPPRRKCFPVRLLAFLAALVAVLFVAAPARAHVRTTSVAVDLRGQGDGVSAVVDVRVRHPCPAAGSRRGPEPGRRPAWRRGRRVAGCGASLDAHASDVAAYISGRLRLSRGLIGCTAGTTPASNSPTPARCGSRSPTTARRPARSPSAATSSAPPTASSTKPPRWWPTTSRPPRFDVARHGPHQRHGGAHRPAQRDPAVRPARGGAPALRARPRAVPAGAAAGREAAARRRRGRHGLHGRTLGDPGAGRDRLGQRARVDRRAAHRAVDRVRRARQPALAEDEPPAARGLRLRAAARARLRGHAAASTGRCRPRRWPTWSPSTSASNSPS